MLQLFLIGTGAGLAAALLFVAPAGGTILAFPLFAVAGLPIAIAGLGWNPLAALIAALVGAAALLAGISPMAAAVFLLLSAGPIAWLTRLATLSRPVDPAKPEGARHWFPLGRILLHAAGAVAGGIIVTGVLIGFDPESFAAEMTSTLTEWLAATPNLGPVPSPTELAPFVRLNVAVMPFVVAVLALSAVVLDLWLGAVVTRISGRFQRPKERLWTVSLPNGAAIGFIVAAAGSFIPGPIGEAAAVAAGAFGCAVAMVGLAVIHALTLGSGARAFVLGLTYALLFVFGFPLVIFAILGIGESVFHLRARRFGGAPPKT
jgi:hypothetical protein